MDFPKRTKQHKAQSDSFAILLYKLKDLGIFRNATENDYGIDFEIEIVHDDRVIGRYLKAQVKSAEEIYVRGDGIPIVSGIKQSTLLYWIELSYRVHIVAFAVDLKTEKVYHSKPLFWQATCLLDDTDSTKTIEFISHPEAGDVTHIPTQNKLQELLLKYFAFDRSITETIFAHKSILRNLKNIFSLYTDLWHYDYQCEVFEMDIFRTFLEGAQILIREVPDNVMVECNSEDAKNIFNLQYWARKTGWGGDEVTNAVAQTPMKILMPLLLDKMDYYNNLILKGKYYWLRKDIFYLKMVYNSNIPIERSHKAIQDLDVNFKFSEEKPGFFNL